MGKRINIAMMMVTLFALDGADVFAKYHEPYDGSRIYWDVNSQREVFQNAGYGRIRQLRDGRLMAVAGGSNGIVASYSSDYGSTWSVAETIAFHGDKLPIVVPDLIQLTDGTIIVGYNPRPSTPYSEDRRFGIRTIRSTDNGKTWSDPSFVYDASYIFEDGCWEPSFLQLPSGEVHCYFSNEGTFTSSGEQDIVVSRSFDNGVTWGDIERVSFRAGSRDGMPSAIITEAGEIVIVIEDNGHPSYGNFRATTVRCSLDNNWSTWVDANSSNRNMIFANDDDKQYISAAPYICQLKNGDTAVSWQGNHDRPTVTDLAYFDMFVAVGDKNARNFKAVTQPFAVDKNSHSNWNSLAVDDEGSVYAIASIAQAGKSDNVKIIKGQVLKGFEANYGTPTIDGSFTKEDWTKKHAQQVFMGTTTRNRATMDFLYDRDNLYFFARVIDRTIYSDKIDNDGIFLYLDTKNASDTYPQNGMFRLFLNVNGEVEFSAGNNNKWNNIDTPENMQFVVVKKTNYYDMEIAIPWKAMGYESAPVDNSMRCNIEVRDRRDSELVLETIAETISRQSWTWPEFKLNYDERASLEPVNIGTSSDVKLLVNNGNLQITSAEAIESVRLFAISGMCIGCATPKCNNATLNLGGFVGVVVAQIELSNGMVQHRKILAKTDLT